MLKMGPLGSGLLSETHSMSQMQRNGHDKISTVVAGVLIAYLTQGQLQRSFANQMSLLVITDFKS